MEQKFYSHSQTTRQPTRCRQSSSEVDEEAVTLSTAVDTVYHEKCKLSESLAV